MHEIERFPVRSDDGAYETVIVIYQELIDAPTRSSPNRTIPGLKRATTADGFDCNHKGDGVFEIVNDPAGLGMLVRRIMG